MHGRRPVAHQMIWMNVQLRSAVALAQPHGAGDAANGSALGQRVGLCLGSGRCDRVADRAVSPARQRAAHSVAEGGHH